MADLLTSQWHGAKWDDGGRAALCAKSLSHAESGEREHYLGPAATLTWSLEGEADNS